jgi:competence protein ComEA
MTDAEDVHTRWRESLARTATRAYRAASRPPAESRGFRWRLEARPAIALIAALALILVIAWRSLDPAVAPLPRASIVPGGSDLAEVVVHVTGAVASPGVVSLETGSRVEDAVSLAGGLTTDADESAVNLARFVVDGEQIYVPRIGETDQTLNLNRASAAELEALPGVGPVLAERIVADRDAHGPYASIEDLNRVSGIGDSVIAKIAEVATV